MIDVVFVDDELELADELAQITTETLGLRVVSTDNPDEALRLVREEGVKVVVLDQKMPRPGVELGDQVRRLDGRVRRILLSGEASASQVTAAYDSGFDRHLHKNDASSQLQTMLRRALLQYDRALRLENKASSVELPSILLSWFPKWPRIRRKLLTIDSREEEYVFPDSWLTRGRVEAGRTEKTTTTVNWSYADELKYEFEDTHSLSAKVSGGKAIRAETALKREIARKASVQVSRKIERNLSFESTLSLPEEGSTDPSRLRIVSRSYEVAPVYLRIGVTLSGSCTCCGVGEIIKADYYVSRRSYATRQVNYLSDGTTETVNTGVEVG